MGDRCRADYNQLNQIANVFNQQSDAIRSMNQGLNSAVEQLRGKDWVGKGADKFINEWDSSVKPTLQRLERALSQASSVTKKISQVWKQAEQESSNCFHL